MILCLFLSSCRTRQVTVITDYQTIAASMQIMLDGDGFEQTKTKASLRMSRDEFMTISVQPALGIELFRLTLMPDTVSIIDRINRLYLLENAAAMRDTPITLTYSALQQNFERSRFESGVIRISENPRIDMHWRTTKLERNPEVRTPVLYYKRYRRITAEEILQRVMIEGAKHTEQ